MQALITGAGELASLPGRFSEKHVLLLTYGRAAQAPELTGMITRWRETATIRHIPFSTSLLTLAQLSDLSGTLAGAPPPELIVSIGGGAVQDAAKCLRLMLGCNLAAADLLNPAERSWQREFPHLAVPTTAGTGSEATCFATVYQGETKHSVEDPRLLPSHVLLDPTLLASVPRETAISCGFDALAQAMESVWSVHASPASVEDALAAARAILGAFEAAIAERSLPALAEMQRGAYLAGRAIQVSRTTLAHALSYSLSARFGLPHGLAVFLNLPFVIRFNGGMDETDCQDPEGLGHVHAKMARLFEVFGVSDHAGLARAVEGWFQRFGVSPAFEAHGVSASDRLWALGGAAASNRSGNNPRKVSIEGLRHELL